jgi:hypothetical protein
MSLYGAEDRSSLHEAYHTLSWIRASLLRLMTTSRSCSFPLIIQLACTLLTAASAQLKSGMQQERFSLLQCVLDLMALAMIIFTASDMNIDADGWLVLVRIQGYWIIDWQGTSWNKHHARNIQGISWQGISWLVGWISINESIILTPSLFFFACL